MATQKPGTVAEYLKSLPPERRREIAAVRDAIRRSLPDGYEEAMNYGIIYYQVPLARLPDTYNKQPLAYVGLAAQKNYNALYLMRVYGDKQAEKQLRDAFTKAGKKLDMGKSCVRFKAAEDLPLDAISQLVASMPMDTWVEIYKRSRHR